MIFGLGACFSAPTTPIIPSVPNRPVKKLPTVKEQEEKNIILFNMTKNEDVIKLLYEIGKPVPRKPADKDDILKSKIFCKRIENLMKRDAFFRNVVVRLLGFQPPWGKGSICIANMVKPREALNYCKEMNRKLLGISRDFKIFSCIIK